MNDPVVYGIQWTIIQLWNRTLGMLGLVKQARHRRTNSVMIPPVKYLE